MRCAGTAQGGCRCWSDTAHRRSSSASLQVEAGICTRCTVAWQPDQGLMLAAPGSKGGVVLYERDVWQPVATLAPDTEIHTLCFSPDGEDHHAAESCALAGVADVLLGDVGRASGTQQCAAPQRGHG